MIRALKANFVLLLFACALNGCKQPYRVGEHVLVEWEDGTSQYYPAYIVERVSATRYRVHFDGYDSRYDEDISLDRIGGRVEGPVVAPPPPKKVARAAGVEGPPDTGAALAVNPYKTGDRIRVRWRGSVYTAIVLDVVAKDRMRVHYEGHEPAWDEIVGLDRVAGRR